MLKTLQWLPISFRVKAKDMRCLNMFCVMCSIQPSSLKPPIFHYSIPGIYNNISQ